MLLKQIWHSIYPQSLSFNIIKCLLHRTLLAINRECNDSIQIQSLVGQQYLAQACALKIYTARSIPTSLNKQSLQNSAESSKRTTVTLRSLCLPSCVRETRSWFIYGFRVVIHYLVKTGCGTHCKLLFLLTNTMNKIPIIIGNVIKYIN